MDAEEQPPDERVNGRRRTRGEKPIGDEARRAAVARYYAKHRDQKRESAKGWRAENPDRARAHNREYMRRALAARKAQEARRANGRAWYHEHRDEERARHRRFRAEHPDKVREYQQRYRAKHPDRAAESSRRAAQRWRDANAERTREMNRLAAQRRRQEDPDYQRRKYQEDIEAQRARSRNNARQRARLRALGLPARHIHTVYAADKRADQAAADAFFTARRTAPQLRDLELERRSAPATRRARAGARRTATGIDSSPLEGQLILARNIDAERALWARMLPDLITRFTERHRDRIREEIRMDSIARQLTGKPAYDIAVELAHRIRADAFRDAANHLAPDGDRARLQRLHQMMFPRHEARQKAQMATTQTDALDAAHDRRRGMSR